MASTERAARGRAEVSAVANVDRFVEQHSGLVRFWLVLGPSLVGFYPMTGLINPFWGSLSGWPVYLAATGHPVYGPHPWYELAALIGGPLAALLVKIVLSAVLLEWRSRWRTPLMLLWAASAFAVLPFHEVTHVFQGWPVWCACE